MGEVIMPGGLQGQQVSAQQALALLLEQSAWPQVSEWVSLEACRFGVFRQDNGQRVVWIQPMGSRRGYRFPLDGVAASILIRDLETKAAPPPSDEVAAAEAGKTPPVDDEPPAPPTMGQS